MKFFMCALAACLANGAVAAEYFGIIEPYQIIKVGSPVLGVVDRLPVDRGDRVARGETLTGLNHDIEEIDLALAKVRYQLAINRYNRQAHLKKSDLVSSEEFEQTGIEMELARLELERREIFLKQKTIVSPVEGVITNRLVRLGEYVYEQVPVMEIAQTHPLNVEILVPFSEYGKIKKGMKIQVIIEEPIGGQYIAEVDVVDEVMDAASSTFGVRLRLPNPDGLIPSGVKCTVSFGTELNLSEH